MEDKIKELITKRQDILDTLYANKTNALEDDHYPYNMDIECTKEHLSDLKDLVMLLEFKNNLK